MRLVPTCGEAWNLSLARLAANVGLLGKIFFSLRDHFQPCTIHAEANTKRLAPHKITKTFHDHFAPEQKGIANPLKMGAAKIVDRPEKFLSHGISPTLAVAIATPSTS